MTESTRREYLVKSFAPLRLCAFALILIVITACQPAPTAVPAASLPTVEAKLIATVYISPTPGQAEQQATRLALHPTATEPPAPPAPTATIYVGIFLGQSDSLDDSAPVPAFNVGPAQQIATPPPASGRFSTCPMPPDERFGTTWQTNTEAGGRLGCPAEGAIPYSGTTQIFERGAMYFTPDGAIWAISTGDNGRYWYVPQAPAAEPSNYNAPGGLRVPVFGFGAMWAGVPGVSDALGYARTDEQAATFTIQRFQGGTLLYDNGAGQVFVLVGADDRGTAYGPY
jgi:hypothetical protein